LEQLGFTAYLLAVPEYNKPKLEGKVQQVKEILSSFSYPYIRRIAAAHGNFKNEDYRKWLVKVKKEILLGHLRGCRSLTNQKSTFFGIKTISNADYLVIEG
jgi:hypothetical protein